MARFSVGFLGCTVSHADARAVRERLLADGHTEADAAAADIAVVNTCCVTHEAVSKSRQAVSRAARAHARVYVTGCAANLAGACGSVAKNIDGSSISSSTSTKLPPISTPSTRAYSHCPGAFETISPAVART